MTKQLFLAVGCLALLALFTAAAMADDITFTFTHDPAGNALTVNATHMIFAQPDDVTVKNSSGTSFDLGVNARAGIRSSNGTYTATATTVAATYAGGAPGIIQVEVLGGVGGYM